MRARELILVGAAYTVLALWWLWPLPAVMGRYLAYFFGDGPLDGADVYLVAWALAWDTHALFTAPARLFHANTSYPLCGAAMYAFARRFTRPPAAAVAGFFYAFYLWRYTTLAHVHML